MFKKLSICLIKIYQTLSRLMPGKCRYYPTCSEYALWQLETNNSFLALFRTTLRIAKCNQLFDGGIDYPIVTLKPKNVSLIKPILNTNYGKINIKYWFVPKDTKHYYVVKDFNDHRAK